jgi:hypothetical protein
MKRKDTCINWGLIIGVIVIVLYSLTVTSCATQGHCRPVKMVGYGNQR